MEVKFDKSKSNQKFSTYSPFLSAKSSRCQKRKFHIIAVHNPTDMHQRKNTTTLADLNNLPTSLIIFDENLFGLNYNFKNKPDFLLNNAQFVNVSNKKWKFPMNLPRDS